jgi:hypothetical protein
LKRLTYHGKVISIVSSSACATPSRFMSTCLALLCFARHHMAKQLLLDAHCTETACLASSFPSVALLGHVVVEEAGVVGQAWLLTR